MPKPSTTPATKIGNKAVASGPSARPMPTLRTWLRDNLADLPRESSILAVGCEEAFLGAQLLDYASNVVVLDTCGGQVAQLAPRFPEIGFARHTPGRPLPFAPEKFDAVCCCGLLDRLFDPTLLLDELQRVLVPGGRVLLSVSSHGGARPVVARGVALAENAPLAPLPRIHPFTRQTMVRLVRGAGFREVSAVNGNAGAGVGEAAERLLVRARRGAEVRQYAAHEDSGPNASAWSFDDDFGQAARTHAA